MISHCKNKIVQLILTLSDLCWDYALRIVAERSATSAPHRRSLPSDLVQVGKQSFVLKDKYRISMDTTVHVALSFESWNIDCHAMKVPNEHDGGKTRRNLDRN